MLIIVPLTLGSYLLLFHLFQVSFPSRERAFFIKFTEEIKVIVHEFHGLLYNFLMQIVGHIIS